MRHPSLPSTLTAEQLGAWIDENKIEEPFDHILKEELTPEEISEHEHKVALASRQLMNLEELKKEFMDTLKNGTPVNLDMEYQPVDITIPPTKGVKALKANVEFHSEILEKGYNEQITKVYKVPYPEAKMIIAVDIEGNEFEDYSRRMTPEEQSYYNTLFEDQEKSTLGF